jgi:hypothetical protein
MAYREVAMVDVKEVLRLWMAGVARKRIAAQLGLDPKTVRRYLRTAARAGLRRSDGEATLTDERVAVVLVALKAVPTWPHGAAWVACMRYETTIAAYLRQGVRLTKIRKLLRRQGVALPYATLRRFAIAACGFGRTAPLPGLDLHRRLFALPLRLSVLRRDDGECDRGVRGRLGILRWRLPGADPG